VVVEVVSKVEKGPVEPVPAEIHGKPGGLTEIVGEDGL